MIDTYQADRQRAEAQGIIREVHGYCEAHCPRRESCPGMACKLYVREQVARDTITRLDEAEAATAWDPEIFGGVILEPTVGRR